MQPWPTKAQTLCSCFATAPLQHRNMYPQTQNHQPFPISTCCDRQQYLLIGQVTRTSTGLCSAACSSIPPGSTFSGIPPGSAFSSSSAMAELGLRGQPRTQTSPGLRQGTVRTLGHVKRFYNTRKAGQRRWWCSCDSQRCR